MRETGTPVSIICFGDSLTEGHPHAEADKWTTRLQWLLEQSHPGAFRVYTRGVAGNTSAQGLDRFGEAVLPFLPGWVIIAFGINDCNIRLDRLTPRVGVDEFASNLREIIRMVRARDGTPILLLAHSPGLDRRDAGSRKYDQGNGLTYADNYRAYCVAVRHMARLSKTPLVDMPESIARQKTGESDLLAEDGVHLMLEGNHFYAEEVHKHLSTFGKDISISHGRQ